MGQYKYVILMEGGDIMSMADSCGKDYFELSESQKNIFDLETAFAGTSVNNISCTIRISGRFDVSLIEKTLAHTVNTDPTFRTRITVIDGVPFQYRAEPNSSVSFPFFDFTLTSEDGIADWENAITREPIPFIDAPLYDAAIFKTEEYAGGILLKIHHIISDGWSLVNIGNRIAETYLSLLAGNEPDNNLLPDYKIHVNAEKEYLNSEIYARDIAYWKKKLSDFSEPCLIKKSRSAALSPVGKRTSYRFSEVLNHKIFDYCNENRVSPFAVYYMALAIYLKRIGCADKIAVGVPVLNRTTFEEKQMTGMFVSTLPFLCDPDTSKSINEFNNDLTDEWFDLLRYQKCPFSHITKEAAKSNPNASDLFGVVLSYQDGGLFKDNGTSVFFSGNWHYSGYQAEQLVIHLSSFENNRKYSVDYDYLTQIFSEKEIDVMHRDISAIISSALDNPDCPIWQLPLLSDAEKENVLFKFNQTDAPISDESVSERFFRIAEEKRNKVALIFHARKIYYPELAENVLRYASAIESACPGGSTVCAVSLPRGFELITAMLGISASGNAWTVAATDLPENRYTEIIDSCKPGLIITTREFAQKKSALGVKTLCIEDIGEKRDDINPSVNHLNDLAYVVYTSGSTGKPKGVEIEQINLLNFASATASVYGIRGVLSVCNISFDAFILETVAALLNGHTVILADEKQMNNPSLIAKLITDFGVDFIALTPSRLAGYIRHPDFAKAISSLRSIVCGGEGIPSDLISSVAKLSQARFYNQYGPSETTVGVSYKLLNGAPSVTVGKPMQNCRVYILDDHLQPLPIGAYGDLYIGGLCVGRGYRNAPELTEAAFIPSPFEIDERIYKSGDIACFTPDGEIIIGGRKDGQVKIRGLRIETEEIAARISDYPGITQAAVRVISGDSPYIAAYYTSDSPIENTALISFAASYLPSYMIPAYVCRVDSIPLTGNGKINFALLPEPEIKTAANAPETLTEHTLIEIFSKVLNRDDVTMNTDYFLSGGNSLNATELICEIEDRLAAKIKISDLYAFRTPAMLASFLGDAAESSEKPIENRLAPAPELDFYPLSPIQKSIYLQTSLDPTGTSYNMPGAFRFDGTPDKDRLVSAFGALIAAEEIFRTRFVFGKTDIVAETVDNVLFDIPFIKADSVEEASKIFIRPFKLDEAPLIRAAIYTESDSSWVLFIDMHHIIGDGISTPVIFARLEKAYSGKPLGQSRISYKDYAYMLSERTVRQSCNDYWSEYLGSLPEPLQIPTDMPRAKQFDFKGSRVTLPLGKELSSSCTAFAKSNDVTVFAFFTAIFGLIVSGISGSEDFIIGTPVSERTASELRDMIGPLITTMPLRLRPRKNISFSEYLFAVKQDILGIMSNSDLALDDIISIINLPHSAGPLYNMMFSMRPILADSLKLCGQTPAFIQLDSGKVKMDFTVEVYSADDEYYVAFDYAAALFSRETVELYARSFRAAAASVINSADALIDSINILSPVDRIRLIDRPLRVGSPIADVSLDALVDEQSEIMPDETAMVFRGKRMTYKELKRRSDSIAAQIIRAGACPGDRIGVYIKRGFDLFAALLAIIKAGCAYIPTSTALPADRISYMLSTAEASLIISDGNIPFDLPCDVLILTDEPLDFAPTAERTSKDLIHVIFTSGSTGKPKGVKIKHESVNNLLAFTDSLFSPVRGAVLCATSIVFDICIVESLIPLAIGRKVIIADENEMMQPWNLAKLIEDNGISIIFMTPSRIKTCLNDKSFAKAMSGLRLVMIGGEQLPQQTLDAVKENTKAKIYNLYGPTEATVMVTAADLTNRSTVVIGRPIPNTRLYVLDNHMRYVLPTSVGELYIAGIPLSDGYINRPELTNDFFLPDPFVKNSYMYKTGDMVRLLTDGNIDCIGRYDSQVKVNGQRIELSEISGSIMETGLCSEAEVISVKREDGSSELRAFTVPLNGEAECDFVQIKKLISAKLPYYMIPSEFIKIDGIPLTPTGKADIRALATVKTGTFSARIAETQNGDENTVSVILKSETADKSSDNADKSAPPVRITKDNVITIWKDILLRDTIDENISFFDQGGTSLTALNVIIKYYALGKTMSISDFYDNPTVVSQLAFFGCGNENEKEDEPSEPKTGIRDFSNRNAEETITDNNEDEEITLFSKKKRDSIILTGVTGFLGAHLLREIIESGNETVYCPVRGDVNRAELILTYYFGKDWFKENSYRIKPFAGDVSQNRFGMDYQLYKEIIPTVGTVVHAAADIRHFVRTDDGSVSVNITGTQNAVDIAKDAGAKLLHISTISVSGNHIIGNKNLTVRYTENDTDIGQNWHENVYVRTKFIAENIVREAMNSGLDAKIFRVGRLVGRSDDGKFQYNPDSNYFREVIRAIVSLGCLPQETANLPIELSAVDLTAKAIIRLRNSVGKTFHVFNPYMLSLQTVVNAAAKWNPPTVSSSQFKELIEKRLAYSASENTAILIDATERIKADSATVTASCDITVKELKKRGFEWHTPDPTILLRDFITKNRDTQ